MSGVRIIHRSRYFL